MLALFALSFSCQLVNHYRYFYRDYRQQTLGVRIKVARLLLPRKRLSEMKAEGIFWWTKFCQMWKVRYRRIAFFDLVVRLYFGRVPRELRFKVMAREGRIHFYILDNLLAFEVKITIESKLLCFFYRFWSKFHPSPYRVETLNRVWRKVLWPSSQSIMIISLLQEF